MNKKSSIATQPGFDQKLLGYSVTAGAALALAPLADAQIKNLTLFSYNSGGSFTATPPDTTVFVNLEVATASHSLVFNFGVLRAGNGYLAVANHGPLGVAVVSGTNIILLASGAPIAATGRNFQPNGQQVFADGGGHFQFKSHTGYLGFKGYANAHTYYGWLRAKVTGNSEIALVAKNGEPGVFGAIGLAGSGITAGEFSAIPEPAIVPTGLALFALGAAGVREHRRRRKLAA